MRNKLFILNPVPSIVFVPPVTATWSTTDHGTGWLFTNGNLTATKNNANWNSLRATPPSASSGKKYFEATMVIVNAGQFATIGIANAAFLLTAVLGDDANSTGVTADTNFRFNGGLSSSGLGTFTAGDIIGVAFDIGASLIWFRKNGGNWNGDPAANPATGANGQSLAGIGAGPYFIAGSGASTDSMTLNSGGSAYTQVVPSGYGNF